MKKLAIVAALMTLAGCAQIDNYSTVVKAPAPEGLAGYWQTMGPQSALVSPQAMASLIITRDGDTLDCRQWQRVIALPGKLTLRDKDVYNVTHKLDVYAIEREGNSLSYDGMPLQRVARPTVECEKVLAKTPLKSTLP